MYEKTCSLNGSFTMRQTKKAKYKSGLSSSIENTLWSNIIL